MVSITYSIEAFTALFDRYLSEDLLPQVAFQKAVMDLGKEYGLVATEITVTGWPLYSLNASGKYREKVFVTLKGNTYIRNHVIPKDPKSEKQLAQRAKWKEVASSWKSLTDEQKAQFISRAAVSGRPISGFNLYMEERLHST